MKHSLRRNHSPPIVRLALIIAAVLLIQGGVWAEDIQITGTTAGSFGQNAPAAPCEQVTKLGGLTYTCGGFDSWTYEGQAGIGGADGNNLGTFMLEFTPFSYINHVFNLFVTITLPPGSPVGSSATLPLNLSVGNNGHGGVHISGGGPLYFAFPNGTLSLGVDALNLSPGHSAPLTGSVTFQSVPESFDLALVGLGTLVTVIRRVRRRTA